MRTRGRRMLSPAVSLATASPIQRMRAVGRQHELRRPAPATAASARASISPASAFCAAARSALASGPAAVASGAKRKPSSRPIAWPSTTTSPVLVISVSSIVFSRSRRISTLVRRSTKRSASRSCSASDSLSSTARATPCQCSGSASQSGRFAAKVQVLICAIRVRQRIDVAVGAIGLRDLLREPIVGNSTLSHQKTIEGDHQFGMRGGRDLAVVGNLADFPQPLDRVARRRHRAHLLVARRMLEHQDVLGDRRARQPLQRRHGGERGRERAERGEIEIGVAPLQDLHGLEAVALERLHQLRLERRAASGGAERAVAHRAAGAAGDLARTRPG